MSRKKIPVSDRLTPLTANPFGGLESAGLPSGPPDGPPAEVAGSGSKISSGRVVLRREKSGRGGKTVVIVSDFAPHFSADDLAGLARRARQACGCGGTVANREIELQGDDPPRVRAFFAGEGFRVDGV